MRFLIAFALAFALLPASYGQDLCVHKLFERSMIANIEGWFINVQHSRARIDIEWRHHEQEQVDTFFIHLPDRPSFKYITTNDLRYIEQDFPKLKRQMAMHHLRDEIANTPIGNHPTRVTYCFTDYYQQRYWTPARDYGR